MYNLNVNIKFFASSQIAEDRVPMPKPARLYVPQWYKDIKNDNSFDFDDKGPLAQLSDIKRCMPFLDGLTTGYIQETWTDIWIRLNKDGSVSYASAIGPDIMASREFQSTPISEKYYQAEFVWKMHWLPKLPKGWSAIITSPMNRPDLPFICLSGIIDSDNFYQTNINGGNYPFFIEQGFQGLIPAGTPMYQIIPFKRETWNSSSVKFDEVKAIKRVVNIKKYFRNGYKKIHWQKKSYS